MLEFSFYSKKWCFKYCNSWILIIIYNFSRFSIQSPANLENLNKSFAVTLFLFQRLVVGKTYAVLNSENLYYYKANGKI